MATKSRSRKSKGMRFQKEIKQLLHEYFPEFEDDDFKTAISGESGEDIHISPNARHNRVPLSIECKNTEKLNIWNAIEQTEKNSKDNNIPVVFFRRNRTKPYVVLDAKNFLEILREATK